MSIFQWSRRHGLGWNIPVWAFLGAIGVIGAIWTASGPWAADEKLAWQAQWSKTDFKRHSVPLKEIKFVIPRDRIPAIDKPKFQSVTAAAKAGLPDNEPVIGVVINGDARAYPIRILIWHEIVNDLVGGMPIAVTFCPLCNSAVVFYRIIDGRVLTFGVSGMLRNSDLVMYDRETESLWQQYLGEGLVGRYSGRLLTMKPMRMESFAAFKKRHPEGKVLVPAEPAARAYGRNPYHGYDSSSRPFLYHGALPAGIAPLERVVVVGKQAWSFGLLRRKKRIEVGDLIITWTPGQASALDREDIKDSRDVGNVVVQRRGKDGKLVDAVHDVSFAFAFHAFHPDGKINVK